MTLDHNNQKQNAEEKSVESARDKKPIIAPPVGNMADIYRTVLPTLDFEEEETKWDVAITVGSHDIHSVIAASIQDERLSMDLLRNLTAVDWEAEGIDVVYQLYSTQHRHAVEIKTRLSVENPHLPTVTDIHRGAEWAEREAREMFGIEFDGHPDPRNLLLDEDLDIHPLLKSHPLEPIEFPQGADVELFRKENPITKSDEGKENTKDEKTLTQTKEQAAGNDKPKSELTAEELAEKKAAQTERVKRARELAAARRAELRGGG